MLFSRQERCTLIDIFVNEKLPRRVLSTRNLNISPDSQLMRYTARAPMLLRKSIDLFCLHPLKLDLWNHLK